MKRMIVAVLLVVVMTSVAAADGKKVPITTNSDTARQYFLKGRDFSEKLRAFEALEQFRKAVQEDPQFAMAYLYLGFSEQTPQGFFDNLNKAMALVDKVSPGEGLWIMGVEAGAGGHPQKQQEYYLKLVAAFPQDERAHNLLGNNYFGLQMYQLAIKEYRKCVEINPQFSQPYNQLGYSYKFLEQFSEAEKAFTRYVQLIPTDPNPYDSYAELLMKMGRYDESIDNYNKALKQDPHFVASHLGIATDYTLKKDYDKAHKQLQALYDSARNDGERRASLFASSVSYVQEGNYDRAIEEQQKMYAIAEKLNDASAMAGDLNTIGTILLEAGRADEAKKEFAKADVIISKSNLTPEVKANTLRLALFNQATAALGNGDLATAKIQLHQFAKEVQHAKNQFQVWLAHELAARIALNERDYDKAIQELLQANLQNPQNVHRLAMAYEGKGDRAKAQELYKRVAQFNALNSMNYAFIRTAAQKKVSGS